MEVAVITVIVDGTLLCEKTKAFALPEQGNFETDAQFQVRKNVVDGKIFQHVRSLLEEYEHPEVLERYTDDELMEIVSEGVYTGRHGSEIIMFDTFVVE